MVDMKPDSTPNLSCRTLTTGAMQLVVHEAFDTMLCFSWSYTLSLTPITIVASGFLAGVAMITFFAPAFRCFEAPSLSLNWSEDSKTRYTPSSFQGSLSGSDWYRTLVGFPSTTMESPSTSTGKGSLPWTLSYLRRWAIFSASPLLTATNSRSEPLSRAALRVSLPVLPNPLIATLIPMG